MTIHSEFAQGWTGRGTLTDLVDELERQKDSKIDFVADGRDLNVQADGETLRVRPASAQVGEFLDADGVALSLRSVKQFGARLDPPVPGRFSEALTVGHPDIAAAMLNDLMHANGKRHLVRCLDGKVRAVLSDSYRIMDNFDLAFTALGVVKQGGGEVIEASLSDTHMRLKFTTRDVWDVIETTRTRSDKGSWYAGGIGSEEHLSRVAAKSGDDLPGGPGTVHPLVTLSNSETGHGGLHCRIGILQGICFNLATVEDVVTRIHLGSKLDAGIFSEESIAADSKAIMLKARDAVQAAFDPAKFKLIVAKSREATTDEIAAPQTAVSNFVDAAGMNDDDKESILAHFVRDYDQTRYGLAQAVARYAQDVDDADDAASIEDSAGKLILTPAMIA
jgi:hypothetical protein